MIFLELREIESLELFEIKIQAFLLLNFNVKTMLVYHLYKLVIQSLKIRELIFIVSFIVENSSKLPWSMLEDLDHDHETNVSFVKGSI